MWMLIAGRKIINAAVSVSTCGPSSDDPEAEEEITALPGQKRCVSAHLTVPSGCM